MEREKRSLVNRTEQLVTETEALRVKMESLRNNPALIERIAREQYGMRRPGETVYRIKNN